MSKWLMPLAIVCALTAFNSQAQSIEATQLDIVALDSSIQCNRTFFQSSEYFKGTIFMMPRVLFSAGPNGKQAVKIIPTGKDKFILSLKLYFPMSDEDLLNSYASMQAKNPNACNLDVVKAAINRNISDESRKVSVIAPMPITSIEVSIPGIRETGRIGQILNDKEDVDIIEYRGKVRTVSINITEEERNYLYQQIVTPDGIPALVLVRFQARSRDGSVMAEVDTTALQANFKLQAKGAAFMTQAEVQTALKASFDSRSVKITSTAGPSDSSRQMIEKVIEKVLSEISLSIADAKEDTKPEDVKAVEGKIAVSAVLEAMASKVTRRIQFDQVASAKTATAQTELALKATRLRDSETQEVALIANWTEPSSGITLRAGETTSIAVTAHLTERIDYREKRTYLTTSQIHELGLASYFSILTESQLSLADQNINGNLLAIGTWTTLLGVNTSAYRWIRIERLPVRTRISSGRIARNMEAINQLPITISFTAIGDRTSFTFQQLLEENSNWSGYFDQVSGRIILTAKRDLGMMQFHEDMAGDDCIKLAPIKIDQVMMEKRNLVGKVTLTEPVDLREDGAAIVLQKTILLNVTRPQNATVPDQFEMPRPATVELSQR